MYSKKLTDLSLGKGQEIELFEKHTNNFYKLFNNIYDELNENFCFVFAEYKEENNEIIFILDFQESIYDNIKDYHFSNILYNIFVYKLKFGSISKLFNNIDELDKYYNEDDGYYHVPKKDIKKIETIIFNKLNTINQKLEEFNINFEKFVEKLSYKVISSEIFKNLSNSGIRIEQLIKIDDQLYKIYIHMESYSLQSHVILYKWTVNSGFQKIYSIDRYKFSHDLCEKSDDKIYQIFNAFSMDLLRVALKIENKKEE